MVNLFGVLILWFPLQVLAFAGIISEHSNFSSSIPSETEILANRLSSPNNFFIVNGYNAHGVGKYFYLTPVEAGYFFWPVHPAHKIQAYDPSDGDMPGKLFFQAMLGNEVGDPVVQERTGISNLRNRVPMSSWRIGWKPCKTLSFRHQFERVDHFSHDKYNLRKSLIAKKNRPWSGGNYPPMAVASLGARWHRGLFTAEFHRDKLWIWTYSPVSGRAYPWKGNSHVFNMVQSNNLVFRSRALFMDGILKSTPGKWRHLAAELLYQNSLKLTFSHVDWHISAGARHYEVYLDSLLLPFNRTGFPIKAGFRAKKTFRDSHFDIQLSGDGIFENEKYTGNVELLLGEKAGQFLVTQRLAGYYWNPSVAWEPVEERISGDSRAVFHPDFHHRGIRAELGLGWWEGGTTISASSNLSGEWCLPFFHREVSFSQSSMQLRSGKVDYYSKPVFNTVNFFGIKQVMNFGLDLSLSLKHRHFFENSHKRLDYLVSPWLISLKANYVTPSNLGFSVLSHYLSRKEVRHWGEIPFVVKGHWEHNFSLEQAFLNGRLRFHYTALYAFGNDIREHPFESPYAFRILCGSRMLF